MKNENVVLWDGKINIPKDGEFIKLKKDDSDIKENNDLAESIKEIFINTYDALTEYDIYLNPEEAKSLFLIDTII